MENFSETFLGLRSRWREEKKKVFKLSRISFAREKKNVSHPHKKLLGKKPKLLIKPQRQFSKIRKDFSVHDLLSFVIGARPKKCLSKNNL